MASLSNKDKLTMLSNISTMLDAGIPILEAVDSLAEEAEKNPKKVLTQLSSDLREGKTMASSLRHSSSSFDSVTIHLIEASEEGGNLSKVLKDVTVHLERDMEFVSKVKAALLYPAFVFALFFVIMIVILTYVIPRVSDVFSKLNVDLPAPTRILIMTSDIYTSNIILITILGILFFAALILLFKTKKKFFINTLFKLPILSQLSKNMDLARFSRSISLLLASGISIIDAIDYADNVVQRKDLAKAISNSKDMVSEGKSLADSLGASEKFPPSMIRIINAAEHSGTLDSSFEQLSKHFERQVSDSLKSLSTILEPIMLVIVGIFVGSIMLAIIAPIYQLIGNIQPR